MTTVIIYNPAEREVFRGTYKEYLKFKSDNMVNDSDRIVIKED